MTSGLLPPRDGGVEIITKPLPRVGGMVRQARARSVEIASAFHGWWAHHRTPVLALAVALMSVLAVLKLGDEFRRLVLGSGPYGTIEC